MDETIIKRTKNMNASARKTKLNKLESTVNFWLRITFVILLSSFIAYNILTSGVS